MKKIHFPNADLTCLLQQEAHTPTAIPSCLRGLLDLQDDVSFRFVETLPPPAAVPNPRLYKGKYVWLSRKKNGLFHLNIKSLCAHMSEEERNRFTLALISEIDRALEFIA